MSMIPVLRSGGTIAGIPVASVPEYEREFGAKGSCVPLMGDSVLFSAFRPEAAIRRSWAAAPEQCRRRRRSTRSFGLP
jgi:hypothetical protein